MRKRFVEGARRPVFSKCKVAAPLWGVLRNRGIEKLYRHQAQGIRLIRQGRNVVVTAPTASGKSEIYLIPVMEAALEGKRSLLLFPTKALSRDQLARLREFSILGIRSEVYDGDTPSHQREKIRADLPHVLVSNIDMLHHILMNSRLFNPLWKSLKFVVIDEVHYYSGALGAHAANILRRLKRATARFGTKPQFICLSATIGNAKSFAESLTGEPFSLVDARFAFRSPLEHLIIIPEERSYTTEAVNLAEELLTERHCRKLLLFANSHAVVERLGLMAREKGLILKAYRAGLEREARRRLEQEFRAGNLNALAATSALELGMDIGSVDAVILAGFPGSITRVRQRIGRAGRKGQRAIAAYIARANPLDVYYAEHPKEYLRGEPESCFVNVENEHILKPHLLAAARDHPLSEEELGLFGKQAPRLFAELKREGLLKEWAGAWIPSKEGLRLLRALSIRGASEAVRIYDVSAQKFIGEREEAMALGELFPGAIYLHGGERFESERLDLDKKIAFVRPISTPTTEYTTALRERHAEILETRRQRPALGCALSFGRVHIIDEVYGYVVRDFFREDVARRHLLQTPLRHEFDTLALWVDFPEKIVLSIENFGDGLHGVEHVAIAMAPALTGADPGELGGISYPSGRMFVYESYEGGVGATEIFFDKFEKIMRMTADRLFSCRCKAGCPACVLDPLCGNNNQHLDKEAARKILHKIFGRGRG
ncbi:MAG: DEAD/DEAH box helicase [Candidatus Micrarchaeia archaeon]